MEWSSIVQRPHHIMRRYSRLAPVLFVDPPRRAGKSAILPVAKRELKEASPSLWTFSSSKALPFDRTFPPLRAVNVSVTRNMIKSAMGKLGIKRHILWCYRYDSLSFKSKPSMIVYDCVDDWQAFEPSAKGIEDEEARLVKASDVVFATAQRLYESKKRINPNTHLVPNGVDFEHFSRAAMRPQTSPVMESITHPIIGFSGAVHSWIDMDLMEELAKHSPDYSFVFVGPVGDRVRAPSLPNMHFLGPVPYDELPPYVASFDVCVLPFRRTALTESVNPIKLYEYLAAGKPVVSTGIPEVRRFGSLVEIAEDAPGFKKAISICLKDDSLERIRTRMAMAAENSWENRFETMMRIVGERRDDLGV